MKQTKILLFETWLGSKAFNGLVEVALDKMFICVLLMFCGDISPNRFLKFLYICGENWGNTCLWWKSHNFGNAIIFLRWLLYGKWIMPNVFYFSLFRLDSYWSLWKTFFSYPKLLARWNCTITTKWSRVARNLDWGQVLLDWATSWTVWKSTWKEKGRTWPYLPCSTHNLIQRGKTTCHW